MLLLVSIEALPADTSADHPKISWIQQAVGKGSKQDVSEVHSSGPRSQDTTPPNLLRQCQDCFGCAAWYIQCEDSMDLSVTSKHSRAKRRGYGSAELVMWAPVLRRCH